MLTMLMLALLACSDPPSVGPEAEPAQGCPTDQPDLVVISIDTTRADRLGFMDHPAAQTPNLDALAARGQVFTGAIAPVPRTTPAIASLMTGLAPHHHGAREVGEVMTAPSPLALTTRPHHSPSPSRSVITLSDHPHQSSSHITLALALTLNATIPLPCPKPWQCSWPSYSPFLSPKLAL